VSTYKNAVIRHGSAAIRRDVAVDYAGADVSLVVPDTPSWGGRLLPPNNTGLSVGQQYTLVLPQFTPAKIVITEEPHPSDGVVPFKGVGAEPRSAPVVHPKKR
jgi:hypothetical protein